VHIHTTDTLQPNTERSLLLSELHDIPGEWGVSAETIERIAGAIPGELFGPGDSPLTAGVEAQVRRLLEVAHLVRLLVFPTPAAEWLVSGQRELALATPLAVISRSGGLAYVRDLLRSAWEEAVAEVGNGSGIA